MGWGGVYLGAEKRRQGDAEKAGRKVLRMGPVGS